ncbi:hypothetical protein Y032_0017g3302 [Ancylostoma ceylanicum]|uniref:Uncharacterized protein n=1 Tax=Ancylostoma ceylanicum TaxID=53326 RepID=A0A016V4G7_9BILA|nr:hypothetical protein Y032_0017g3302 [Ancylostoma ceylanicum]
MALSRRDRAAQAGILTGTTNYGIFLILEAHTRVGYTTSERKEIGVTRYAKARRKFGLWIRDQRQKLHVVVQIPSRTATTSKYPSLVS